MAELLRIGIAGAGKIVASEHVPRFRTIPGVELVAVANRTPESSRRAADQLGISRSHAHWGELIEDDEIDAILIGAWPYLHAPIAVEALYAGKHVLTEARMAADSDDAAAMTDAALEHPGLVAMVVPASFSLWADRAIARVLGDGTIGRLLAVRATWDNGAGTNPDDWWRWQRRYSGNNVMALGILYEAMVRWLGPAEWVTAESQIVTPRKPAPGGLSVPTDVPDHLVAVAGFAGDVTATIEMSTLTLRGTGIHVVFVGSEATLAADFGAQTLTVQRPNRARPRQIAIRADERDEWRAEPDFVAAIRGEKTVDLTDFETGRQYMQFVDAVHASNRDGQRVILGE